MLKIESSDMTKRLQNFVRIIQGDYKRNDGL
jgi:hypothetical protein